MIPELQIDTEATVREFSYETAEVAVMKYANKIMKSKSTLGKLAAMMMMIITFFFILQLNKADCLFMSHMTGPDYS